MNFSDDLQIEDGKSETAHEVIIIDLEQFAREGKPLPSHDPGIVIHYRFRVDKSIFERKKHFITGRELLALVGLSPDKYKLFLLGTGKQKAIAPDEIVDLRTPGLERFKSVAKEATEGNNPQLQQRIQFDLLPDDLKFLKNEGLRWEALMVGNVGWILVYDFPIPDGYNIPKTCLALMLPASYPSTEIDMMYFHPELRRLDGREIRALATHTVDNKNFQRWSRHRPSGMWRPGVDNLETHVLAVTEWLNQELSK